MDIYNFKNNLGLVETPIELKKLIHFQNANPDYSQGFWVSSENEAGLKSWSSDNSFLDDIIPFADANGSGSFYAIWNDGTDNLTNELPIVVFGDEGGVHIVAENMLQLLHILTYDREILVDFDTAYFYKNDGEYKKSENLEDYLEWLKFNYNLEQIEKPNELVKSAQEKYKECFDKWLGQYYGNT